MVESRQVAFFGAKLLLTRGTSRAALLCTYVCIALSPLLATVLYMHEKRPPLPEKLNRTSLKGKSEKLDYLVSAAKIADMATGWLAGQAVRDFTATDEKMLSHFDIVNSEEFNTTKYFSKTNFDMKKIKDEGSHYVDLPKIYDFKDEREKRDSAALTQTEWERIEDYSRPLDGY